MSSKKLYAFDTKASLGASDLVYVASADGSTDGKASFTDLRPVLAGVLSGTFAGTSPALELYAAITPSANVQTFLGASNYAAMRTQLGLVIGTNVQAYSANLATFAGIAPSANVQTLLGAADYAAFRTSLGLGAVALLASVAESNLSTSDVTTANVTSTKHGFAPKSPADATQFLNGAATPAFAAVKDSDLSTSDITTNNVSTSKHGFAPKLPNDATKYLDGTGAYSVPAGSGGSATIVPPQGRLSLTSGVAVMIADATAQSTVYYVPYTGKYVPIYDGSNWSMLSFGSGVSLALNSTDNLLNNLYDVFLYSASGTATLGTGPAWTNTATVTMTIATPAVISWTAHGLPEGAPVVFTTSGALPTGITAGTTYYVGRSPSTNSFNVSTSVANAAAGTFVATSGSQSGTHTGTNPTTVRGTGSGTTELELKDGIWTNKNAVALRAGGSSLGSISANRATYLGTVYMTANGQTGMAFKPAAAAGGSAPVLGLWNAYNRTRINSFEQDSSANWAYSAATWRPADGNVNNRVTYVDGLGQSHVHASHHQGSFQSAANCRQYIGIVRDNTVTSPVLVQQMSTAATASSLATAFSADTFLPSLGLHYVQAMEQGSGTSTSTFVGSTGYALIVGLEM